MQVGRILGKSQKLDCNDAIRWMSFFFDPIFSDEQWAINFLRKHNFPEIHVHGLNFLPLLTYKCFVFYELLDYRNSISCRNHEYWLFVPNFGWKRSDEDQTFDKYKLLEDNLFGIYRGFERYYLKNIDPNHIPVNVWDYEHCEWCKRLHEKYHEYVDCPKHAIESSLMMSSYNEGRYFPWILNLKYYDLLIKPTRAIDFIYTGFEDRIIIWYKEKPFTFWKRCKAHESVYNIVMDLMEE